VSVINKMLRDLDSRQAAGTIPVRTDGSTAGIARGTLVVNDSDRTRRKRETSRNAALMAAAAMVLVGAAGAWWYLNQHVLQQRKVDQVKPVPASTPAPPVTSVVTVAAPAGQQKVAEAAPASNSGRATVDTADVPQKVAILAPPMIAKLPMFESGSSAAVSLKMDNTFKSVPGLDTASRPSGVGMPRPLPERSLTGPSLNERTSALASTVPAAALVIPQSLPRPSPALEALALAQSLWNSGSHEAAIDLLGEALAVAERANLAVTPSGNNSVLASLARELARMELADGRVSQALEMLTRLEPALSGFADVWAIRGNAAQRLGRHQESAAAYLMALKLRPDEPRWMLGAAVSLAAQGQTAAAAELAEKARAHGVLTHEVAAYLRQLGVPLR